MFALPLLSRCLKVYLNIQMYTIPAQGPNEGSEMPETPKNGLIDQVRSTMRIQHLAKRTEKAYVYWIREFLRFHKRLAGQWIRYQ